MSLYSINQWLSLSRCTPLEALRRLFLPVAALGVLPSVMEATTIFLVTCWWAYNGRWEIALEQG